MKEYKETLKSIYAKADAMIEKRNHRNAVIKKITFSVSGMCAAAIIGIGLRHSGIIMNGWKNNYEINNMISNDDILSPKETTSAKKEIISTISTITTAAKETSTVNQTDIQQTNLKTTVYDEAISTASKTTFISENTVTRTIKPLTQGVNDPITTTTVEPLSQGSITTTTVEPEIHITNKIPSFEINDIYNGRYVTMGQDAIVQEDMIDVFITERFFLNDIQANIYAIKNFSPDAALAIKFEESNEYYFYVNCLYSPKRFEDLIKDFGLESNIISNKGEYCKFKPQFIITKVYISDTEAIWKELNKCSDAVIVDYYNKGIDLLALYFSRPEFNISGSITIYANGYIDYTGNIGDGVFFVGEEITSSIFKLTIKRQ